MVCWRVSGAAGVGRDAFIFRCNDEAYPYESLVAGLIIDFEVHPGTRVYDT